MRTRITQSDIARVAGVHNTTVSLALRNNPLIPLATRQRIQAIAEEMGYHPDPALQALVAYRNRRMPNRRTETIAYITNWSTRWGWRDLSSHEKFYLGARRRALDCGYQLEHFWFGEPGMSARRLSSMLFYRKISGALFAAHETESEALHDVEGARITAVKIGCLPRGMPCHRVCNDERAMVRVAMQHITAAGYVRIGMVIEQSLDDLNDQAWSGGFLAEQCRLRPEDRVPMLLYQQEQPAANGAAAASAGALRTFERWLYRARPEVIVSVGPFVRTQLARLGVVVPRDVACVDLSMDGTEPGVAGMCAHCERTGEVAMELLVHQLQQNLCGLPAIATSTLVAGAWIDGESLPVPRVPAAHGHGLAVAGEGDGSDLLATSPRREIIEFPQRHSLRAG